MDCLFLQAVRDKLYRERLHGEKQRQLELQVSHLKARKERQVVFLEIEKCLMREIDLFSSEFVRVHVCPF